MESRKPLAVSSASRTIDFLEIYVFCFITGIVYSMYVLELIVNWDGKWVDDRCARILQKRLTSSCPPVLLRSTGVKISHRPRP